MHKIKKVTPRAVSIFLTTFIIFLGSTVKSQNYDLEGRYKFSDPAGLNGFIINFNNTNFRIDKFSDFGDNRIYDGKYFLSDDTLYLIYNSARTKKDEKLKIISKDKTFGDWPIANDKLILDISVIDDNNSVNKGGYMLHLISNQNIVHTILSDSDGKFSLNSDGFILDQLKLTTLNGYSFEVSLDDYWGKYSVIEIYANSLDEVPTDRIEIFKINHLDDGRLTLQSEKSLTTFIQRTE